MNNTRAQFILVWMFVVFAGFCLSAIAQTTLIKNAVVHTVSGETITNGAVLISSNIIQKVISGSEADSATADLTNDLHGQQLYPGLISLDSSLGLLEIDSVRGMLDTTEVGDYTPDVQSWIAVNPASELLPVARANGITHFEATPQGGTVAGMSAVMALDGWTTEQMAIKPVAALHVYWPKMDLDTTPKEKFTDKSKYKSLEDQAKERSQKLKALDDFFREARAYTQSRSALTNRTLADPGINPPWEAMLPAVRGEMPIMVHTSEVRAIKAAAEWSQTNHWPIIIVGGRDAWQVADLLASQKIPVIFECVFNQPIRQQDAYDINFKAPAILQRAGVKVALGRGPGGDAASNARNLPYDASQAVAFGLPPAEALKSITLYPAQLLRLDQRLGSIEPGKEATLFAADGDILDLRSQVKKLWIAGREISLESRHTRLYEQYKNRPLPK